MEHVFDIPLDEMFGNLTIVELDINDILKLKKFKDVNEFERWLQHHVGQMYISKNQWLTMGLRGVLGYVQTHNKFYVAIPLRKEIVTNVLDIPFKVVM